MTISKTFSDAGASAPLFVRSGEKFDYTVDVSGDFDGSLSIERSADGGLSWQTVVSGIVDDIATALRVKNYDKDANYRFRCHYGTGEETLTGTAAVTLAEVVEDAEGGEFKNSAGKTVGAVTEEGLRADKLTVSGDASVGGDQAVTGNATAASTRTTGGVGTPATGVTAVEYGDGKTHQTVLTIASVLPAIAGGASLGVGKLLYTLPAGAHIIESAYMSVAIQQTEENITADTPEVGLGTVIASGAVAVLSGTGTFEDIITGQVAADCDGTATVKTAIPTAAVPLVIEAAGAKTVHLNVADGWAASGDAAAVITGTVVLNWRTMA